MKKIWSDPVWSKVISAFLIIVILFCLSFFIIPEKSNIENLTIYNSLKFRFEYGFEYLYILILKFLNFEIRVWWIIVFLIGAIGILYLIDKFQVKEPDSPNNLIYKKDNFKGWLWTWQWEWNAYQNSWNVSNLKAHCPKCETLLIDTKYFTNEISFDCPRCSFNHKERDIELPSKIEMLILDNIRRKTEV